MHAHDMLTAHPAAAGRAPDTLIACIEACYDCAQACTACADACLAEPMVADLTRCIRLNLDCADLCAATGAVMTRRTAANDGVLDAALHACRTACDACAAECLRHAGMHEHCRICADACEACAAACSAAMARPN